MMSETNNQYYFASKITNVVKKKKKNNKTWLKQKTNTANLSKILQVMKKF